MISRVKHVAEDVGGEVLALARGKQMANQPAFALQNHRVKSFIARSGSRFAYAIHIGECLIRLKRNHSRVTEVGVQPFCIVSGKTTYAQSFGFKKCHIFPAFITNI
ncbi:hypothetical protein SDC9_133693 [bioreactor metagenome]|uniref:Uncharacterized protein n=1 Tax=bioreactor metagenome TaxID=1076179 RepID=A0A645DCE1_9ZZZZ